VATPYKIKTERDLVILENRETLRFLIRQASRRVENEIIDSWESYFFDAETKDGVLKRLTGMPEGYVMDLMSHKAKELGTGQR